MRVLGLGIAFVLIIGNYSTYAKSLDWFPESAKGQLKEVGPIWLQGKNELPQALTTPGTPPILVPLHAVQHFAKRIALSLSKLKKIDRQPQWEHLLVWREVDQAHDGLLLSASNEIEYQALIAGYRIVQALASYQSRVGRVYAK